MYAKAVIQNPGLPDVPLIVLTTVAGSIVVSQLHSAGWTPYGGDVTNQPGQVVLTNDTVHVTSGRYAILKDDQGNPVSPPGWWDAVSRIGDRCLVVVVDHGHLNSFDPTVLADELQSLLDTPHAAQALLPVHS